MLILCGIVVAMRHRTGSSAQYIVYTLCCCLSLLSLNGLLRVIAPNIDDVQHQLLQITLAPTCVAMSAAGLRDWLGTRQRNRVIDRSLITVALLSVMAGIAIFVVLPTPQQLAASACVALASVFVVCGLCLWAAMLGDAVAWHMTCAIAMLGVALTGQFGLALGWLQGTPAHALTASGSIIASLAMSILLWLRSRKEYDAILNDRSSPHYDLTTGLYSGTAIIKKMIKAQERLQIRRAEGNVLAIKVFETKRLLDQIGPGGMQQLYVRLGARVRRAAGLINPVGRYFDRCYVVLVETQYSPEKHAHLMHSLNNAMRKPFEIKGLHGETHAVTLTIGIGSARLHPKSDISTVLDRAQRAAREAVGMTDTISQPASINDVA